MKTARAVLIALVLGIAPGFGAYTYDAPHLLNPYSANNWNPMGVNNASTGLYTSAAPAGGSLIWCCTVAGISNSYEVRATLALPSASSAGGNYVIYLRAGDGAAWLNNGNASNFYAVQIARSVNGDTLTFYKNTGVNTLTVLQTRSISTHDGMVVRAVMNQAGGIEVFIDNSFVTSYYDSSPLTSGQPGVGVSAAPTTGDGFSNIDIGHIDTVAPAPIDATQVGISSFPNHVDFQFPGSADDANGTGVALYQFWRNGAWFGFSPTPQFTDNTVQPSTTYTYWLQAVDYHNNTTLTPITVTTPAAGMIDPRRVGVRALGTYWGSAGEQIDLRSGNLNYTMPLVKATARSGWSASFNLTYNSQNWRQDSGGIWQFGRDVGYGYGWHLQAGSLTPVYGDYWDIDHYVYTDSTGAEYRLDIVGGSFGPGVWYSHENIFVQYDSNTNRLYFRDGSFWTMGSLSSGGEQDAGTLYPTQMEDTNGNIVTVAYDSGAGLTAVNSSARIKEIRDVRDNPFKFTYDAAGHLTGIDTGLFSPFKYNFSIQANQPLIDPFTHGAAGSSALLANVTQGFSGSGQTTSFTYDRSGPNWGGPPGSGTGELTQMNTAYGGHLKWAYQPFTFTGNRTQREVSARYLAMNSGSTETAITIGLDPASTNYNFHASATVTDQAAASQKQWWFQTDPTQGSYGVVIAHEFRPSIGSSVPGTHREDYTWAVNGSNLPYYISTLLTTEDDYKSSAIQKKTVQGMDSYGNLGSQQVYGYGAPGSALPLLRTYSSSYITDPNYISRYIWNRMTSSAVTDASTGVTTTLAQVGYDGLTGLCGGFAFGDPSNGSMTMRDPAYGNSFLYRGDVGSVVRPDATICNAYDVGGNLLSSTTNGVTKTSSTSADSFYAAPTTISTAGGNSTLVWDPSLGLHSASGPNGDQALVSYDTSQRPTTTTSPSGAVTTFSYNDTSLPLTRTATTNGHWTRTTMDGFGRNIKTETGNGTTTVSVVDTVYIPCGCSPLGKVGQVSQPHAPGAPQYWTTYTYDGLGRTTSVLAADGASRTTYAYSANNVTVTDPAGKSKTFTMDALGNLVQVSEPNPAGSPPNPPVGSPVLSPAPGTYSAAQTITITTTTAGATIRYTTDGSAPSETAGTVYSGAITVSATTTIKAIAYLAGSPDSSISSGPYTIATGGGGTTPPWYNTGWSNRKAITVDHTKVSGAGNLSSFPMLFSVTDANLRTVPNGGNVSQGSGNDILFTASDGVTKLNHEIESYNAGTGQLIAWVQIPTLSVSADTVIYAYFGNASAANQQNAAGVWDSNYVGVYHLANGSTLSGQDSSSNALNGTITAATATTGQVDGAGLFNGTSAYVDMGTSSLFNPTTITASAWVNVNGTPPNYGNIMSKDFNTGWRWRVESGSSVITVLDRGATNVLQSNASIPNGTWTYVVFTGTGSGISIYINGVLDKTGAAAWGHGSNANAFQIGQCGVSTEFFKGNIDEARISSIARSADWIKTEYNNQGSAATFYSVGGLQGQGGGSAWYNTSWSNRKPVTVDHTKVTGGSNLANFPVLVSVTDANLKTVANGGGVGQANGNDILFTASDGVTKLNHEIESYNAGTGQLIAWVQIPTLSVSADTVIYAYFGNASAANQQNAAGVWDSNYVGVYHLANGSTLSGQDSSSNALNGTITAATATTGQVDGAGLFNGTSAYVDMGTSSLFNPTTITASAWVNVNGTPPNYGNIMSKDFNTGWRWRVESGSSVITVLDRGATNVLQSNASIPNGTWTYVVFTGTGSGISIYINGVLDKTGAAAWGHGSNANAFQIGQCGISTEFFKGNIDEARLSSIARSAGWIGTEYNNQSSPGTFLSFGAQQGQGGGGGTPQVTAPSYSPAPGNYTSNQSVSITTPTPSATIRYTVDGTTPSQTNGFTYTGAVTVGANETLTAYAYESGYTDSPVTAGGYTVQTGGSFPPYVTTYSYDVLSHLTGVSMTRGSTTQTRSFNYTKANGVVGAELLSATNPENGTVTYTYDSRHRLITKQDAKGVQQGYSFTYAYEDAFNRLLSVSAGGVTLRTYTYDSNSIDGTYSEHVAGRLATITYPGVGYDTSTGLPGTTTFVDMFSYEAYGAIKGKRLRVIKTNTFFQTGQYKTQTATGDLNMSYAHDNEGKVTVVTYPTDANAGVTPQYNYQYDAMSRPSGMSDQNAATVVSGVLYGAANELLSMNYDGGTETRSYNAMFQLTAISGLGQNISYNFPAGSNNGKIASQYDAVSGETVSYQYDSLNRLISASASGTSQWGQTYTYDGFGNLTNRAGRNGAPSMALTVDANTNRLTAPYFYDANGNLLSTGNIYDVENRLIQATMPGGTIQYAYDAKNKRIWQGSFTNSGDPQMLMAPETVSMFGADGQLAASYTPQPGFNNQTNPVGITFTQVVQRVYFGKKLIKWLDAAYAPHSAVQDRLASVGKYYPYGEERNSPALPNDQVKFATYTRDSATGLDYADQRYFASTLGRFTSPDRLGGVPSSPMSWNRYAYAMGDPVNGLDPSGSHYCPMYEDTGVCITDPQCGPEPGFAPGGPDPCPPDPDPYAPPPPPPPTITTQCALSLWATPILLPGTSIPIPGEYHTALVITKVTFSDGTPTSTVTNWLEAYPSPDYLNSGGPEPVPGNGNTLLWSSFFNYGFSESLCDKYNKAFNWATNYSNTRNDQIPYNNLNQNSNTWIWTLLNSIGLTIPAPPTFSPGWGHALP